MSGTAARWEIKRKGVPFFAAGAEVERAMAVLGDGAFKLFVWVCLHADRATGRLAFDRSDLERALGRKDRTLGRQLAELERSGACEYQRPANQHEKAVLRVRGDFWPYRAVGGSDAAAGPARAEADYLTAVREALLRWPCVVRAAWSAEDEHLAQTWWRKGVSLLTVQHAILLGAAYKAEWMLKGRVTRGRIGSLKYFAGDLLRRAESIDWTPAAVAQCERVIAQCERRFAPRGASGGRIPGRQSPEEFLAQVFGEDYVPERRRLAAAERAGEG